MKQDYDVLIVGGGMVGATLACALGDSQLRVGLLEDSPPAEFANEQPHDLRVSAVSIASANILKTIGAWSGITSRRMCPYRRMRVWEDIGDVEFCSDEINEPVLGHIVENRIIQLAVLDRARQFGNVELISGVKTQAVRYARRHPL